MSYQIKEVFYTLQGEGAHVGRPAVFVRFSGCNLWSGKETDRDNAICKFCDTDFLGGTKHEDPEELARGSIYAAWPDRSWDAKPFVVLTGGEPLLQVNEGLIKALKHWRFEIAVETNGTVLIPRGIDWITVSPKANTALVVTSGDELKLVYPQVGAEPERFERLDFKRFYLQPMDGPNSADNVKKTIEFCMKNPRWRLSLQTHKLLDLR